MTCMAWTPITSVAYAQAPPKHEALSAENSKCIMGKRSKELRKRKREQAQRLASSALVSDTNGIYCQPLINVLLSVKAPQSTGTAFYHDALKGFRKSLRGLLDNMAKNYETKSPTTKKQRKEQMKRYNARRDQAERATVDVQEDAADLVARLPLSEAYEVIDRLKALSAAQIGRPEYKHIRTSLHPFVVLGTGGIEEEKMKPEP